MCFPSISFEDTFTDSSICSKIFVRNVYMNFQRNFIRIFSVYVNTSFSAVYPSNPTKIPSDKTSRIQDRKKYLRNIPQDLFKDFFWNFHKHFIVNFLRTQPRITQRFFFSVIPPSSFSEIPPEIPSKKKSLDFF